MKSEASIKTNVGARGIFRTPCIYTGMHKVFHKKAAREITAKRYNLMYFKNHTITFNNSTDKPSVDRFTISLSFN
jgi:hypothetical protein